MNLRAVGWLLGCVLLLVAGLMLPPALVAAWYGERAVFAAFLGSALAIALPGGVLLVALRGATQGKEGRSELLRREELAAVGLGWVIAALAGALPFLLTDVLSSPADALFESVSGFTTTGASVLAGARLEELPRGVVFWRALMQWAGGLATVVVFVAVLPRAGREGQRSDFVGPLRAGVQRRVRDAVLALATVYVGMTALLAALLLALGLGALDAFVHAAGTLSTGGCTSHAGSVGGFASLGVELTLIAFMLAAGLDFSIHEALVRHGPRRAWRLACSSSEVRAYAASIAVASALVALTLWFWGGANGDAASAVPDYSRFLRAARDALFTVVSTQSTTGYVSADYDQWPDACRVLLLLLASVGACAGSTGGGLKVLRLLILGRVAVRGFLRFARPRVIHTVRMDESAVGEAFAGRVLGHCGLWVLVAVGASLLLTGLLSFPGAAGGDALLTSTSSVLACLSNLGPGLAATGPLDGYAALPGAAKCLLAGCMLLGRLELYALAVLLLPRFWRG